jgi:hypothetical protein
MEKIDRKNVPLLNDRDHYLGVVYDPRRRGWMGVVWWVCRTYSSYDNVQPYHTLYQTPQNLFATAEEARRAINAAFPELKPLPPMEELHAQ